MGLPNITQLVRDCLGLLLPGLHVAVTTMSCFFQEVKGQKTLLITPGSGFRSVTREMVGAFGKVSEQEMAPEVCEVTSDT